MKYIKLFEEKTYTVEQKKLVSKLRYKLNKFFGLNCCNIAKHNFGHTDPSMIFKISLPDLLYSDSIVDYDAKLENIEKIADEIGLYKLFIGCDTDYLASEEQIKELIFRMKYIDSAIDAQKYNL